MNQLKIALILLCFIISTNANSQQRISAYKCDDINACTGNCEFQNRKFTFLIDNLSIAQRLVENAGKGVFPGTGFNK
jgi:hypothetical protein